MSLSLPDPIATYFAVSNGAELGLVADCFSEEARVRDEGQTHRGHAAIEAWQRQAQEKFAYRVEPLDATRDGECIRVSTRVLGDFPGSPVLLVHVFELSGDRISSLEIGG